MAEIREETAEARTIVLADELPWRAGHFVTVRIPTDQGPIARSYSLSNGPGEPLAFTVKRVADGQGSNWLCSQLQVGDELRILPPAGTFTLVAGPHPVLLCAAGSGITPVMAMAREVLANREDHVRILYANRDERSVIFAEQLKELSRQHPDRLTVVHWLESLQGLPDARRLHQLMSGWASAADPGARAYLCGPAPFMDAAAEALDGILPPAQIHREVFSSLSGDPFVSTPDPAPATDARSEADGVQLVVELDGETTEHTWPREKKLLDLLLAAGLDAPFSCREGRCSACICLLQKGSVEMLSNQILTAEDLEEGWVLACQSIPQTDDPVQVSFDEG